MTNLYIVATASGPTLRYRWQPQDGSDFVDGTAEELAASINPFTTATVLLDTSLVTLTSIALKARNRRLLLSALPYALEEQLASDIEDLRIELGVDAVEDMHAVAVADDAVIERIVSDLREANVEVNDIVPYALAIPFIEGAWTLFDDGEIIAVRTGQFSGFTAPAAALPRLLERLEVERNERPRRQVWVFGSSAFQHARETDDVRELRTNLLNPWFDEALEAGPVISLAPRVVTVAALPEKKFAVVVMLLLGALFFHTGFLYSKTETAKQQLGQIQADTATTFKVNFPEVKRIVDPRVQADQQLKAMSARQPVGIGFFEGLYALGAAINALDDDTGVRSIRYEQGRFSVALDVPDIGALENIRTALTTDAIDNEIVSVENRIDRVVGQLQLDGGER